jgi:hypothetical protein
MTNKKKIPFWHGSSSSNSNDIVNYDDENAVYVIYVHYVNSCNIIMIMNVYKIIFFFIIVYDNEILQILYGNVPLLFTIHKKS